MPLVSKNFGCRLICPVTVAPAWIAAALMPLTTEDWAPGSVTISSRCPVSRSCSTAGSTAWAYISPSVACCWAVSRWLLTWPSSFCSFEVVLSSRLNAGPLQLGRAEHDPDRQREEHRHDGDEMVAKIDH